MEFSAQEFYECMKAVDRSCSVGSSTRALIDSAFSKVGGIKGAQRRLKSEMKKEVIIS